MIQRILRPKDLSTGYALFGMYDQDVGLNPNYHCRTSCCDHAHLLHSEFRHIAPGANQRTELDIRVLPVIEYLAMWLPKSQETVVERVVVIRHE